MPDTSTLNKPKRKPAVLTRVRTTLQAVADRAGVSKGLASRVLNGGSTTIPISEETIQRVRQAAADLRYIPSRMARSLSKGARSHIIGFSVVATNLADGNKSIPNNEFSAPLPENFQKPLFGELMKFHQGHDVGYLLNEISQHGQEYGEWDVVIRHRKEHLEHPFTPLDLGLDLVEGLIYGYPSANHMEILDFARSGIPVVLLGHVMHGQDVCSVGIDNYQSGARLVRHLVDLGRTHVAAMWPFDHQSLLAEMRSNAFHDVLKSNSLTPVAERFVGSQLDTGRGYWLTRQMLAAHPDIDAIAFGANELARGAAYAIQETGRRIPDDIAIATFGDNLFNILETPQLTCIRVPVKEMITLAFKLVTRMIDGHYPDVLHHFLVPPLIVRESCGALSAEKFESKKEEDIQNVFGSVSY